MPAAGFVTDLLLFVYVAASLLAFGHLARRAGRHRGAAVLAVLGGLAAAFTAGECWMRYVHDAPTDGLPTLATRAWYRRHWHPETNADGFRDRPWTRKKEAGTQRILLLGDEAVGGYGIDDTADRAAARLEAALGPGTEVWTVALPGWNTGRALEWLARNAAKANADRVVLVHSLDDAIDLIPAAQLDVRRLSETRPTWWNPARSFLMDELWLRTVAEQSDWMQARIATVPTPTARQRQTERLRRVVAVCESAGVPLDVAVLPWLDPDVPTREAVLAAALRDWSAVTSGRVIDLSKPFVGRENEFRIGSRAPWPNEAGHAAIAERLRAALSVR